MSELTDQHLLSAWAERRDEAAFRSLLGRYAGFVYGVALRRMGDAGLAEEISQDVFARLAHHAPRLTAHPTLAGWLHRAAMLLVLDHHRRRARYDRKLAQFTQMKTQPARDPWADATPHLDEALDRLPTPDREVLMLHFIEHRTFPEIATHLRSTPDAVRMRTTRALAALSALLRKRGTIIPAATLAAGLGTATAAPPSLLAFAPAALGVGKVSALSVIIHAVQTMKLAKATAFTALALVLAPPLIFQHQQIAAAEERIANLHQQRVSAVAELATSEGAENEHTKTANRGIDIRAMGKLAVSYSYAHTRAIRDATARLDGNNLAGLIEVVLQGGLMRNQRDSLLVFLLDELKFRDRVLHLTWSMKTLATLMPVGPIGLQSGNFAYGIQSNAAESFREWIVSHPAEAAQWANDHRDEWLVFQGRMGTTRFSLNNLLAGGLLKADPERAFAMLEAMPTEDCLTVLDYSGHSFSEQQLSELTAWGVALADSDKRRRIVRNAITRLPLTSHEREAKLEHWTEKLTTLNVNDADFDWICARLIHDSVFQIQDDVSEVPQKELDWVAKNIPADRQSYVRGAIGHLFRPKAALVFLGKQLDAAPDDDLIAGYVESEDMRWHMNGLNPAGGRHGETAFKLATRTENPVRRIELLARAWADLHEDSANAADSILATPELSDEDRTALEKRMPTLKDSTR